MNECIVLTGASGFLGTQVLTRILRSNATVVAITRCQNPHALTHHPNLIWTSWAAFKECIIGKNLRVLTVIHLATNYGRIGDDWKDVAFSNVENPIALFKDAILCGAKRIVTADSFFGKPKFNYQYLKYYIQSKNLLSEWGNQTAKELKIDFFNVRLEHVFGPNDNEDKFFSKLIKQLDSREQSISLTEGSQKRDFIYIDDAADGLIHISQLPDVSGFIQYELGTGSSITLKSACEVIAKEFNRDLSVLNFGALPMRENEIMDSSADIRPLILSGWSPQWTFKRGISRIRSNYLENLN